MRHPGHSILGLEIDLEHPIFAGDENLKDFFHGAAGVRIAF